MGALTLRVATLDDVPQISELMHLAIAELQKDYLSPTQLEASKAGMGLDLLLVTDGTYFVVHDSDTLVGCGGWSFRATLYGGNHSIGRDDRLLDPKTERAKIRAMYTHPSEINRGIGRMVIEAGEAAALAHGFRTIEMAASMAGKPFYLKCGYTIEYEWLDERESEPVPLAKMTKALFKTES